MPSFDIVNELDFAEIDNAVNQATKEISTRFDFRGGKSSIKLDKDSKVINVLADDEMKLRSIHQILETKLSKRSVDIRCLEYGAEEQASGNMIRQKISLKEGIEKDNAKKITKLIKDMKLKVQAQVQDQQVRVSGKKIDDLQEVISQIKQSKMDLPLQFINMRS